jgi:F0F1-type ATP synthase membrane subunit b/b'
MSADSTSNLKTNLEQAESAAQAAKDAKEAISSRVDELKRMIETAKVQAETIKKEVRGRSISYATVLLQKIYWLCYSWKEYLHVRSFCVG